MGSGYEIKCNMCEYSKTFMLGVGMTYDSLNSLLGLIHYKKRDKIKYILENAKIIKQDYYKGMFKCEKCNGLYERFYYEIEYEINGEIKVEKSAFKCPKCKKELKDKLQDFDEKIVKELNCPNCRKRSLEIKSYILWD